ncbi:MAG TPA: DUF2071 domain-containing protein [Bacteroidia bacterium]|nr:DUF2071 domain-containing protein [Bacteroidia bacterium]
MNLPCLLRANPFPVEAWFDFSCTLTYALPVEEIAARLPRGLVPDTYDGHTGFLAVAVVQTRRLRPAGLPEWLGHDFVLVGYRFFVRFTNASGRTLRGLYILRSETDKPRMAVLGNLFTRYRYVRTSVHVAAAGDRLEVADPKTGLEIAVDLSDEDPVPLPDTSPFPDWKTARRFCGPMPFTFSIDEDRSRALIVEGRRTHWQPQPVRVLGHRVPWLADAGFSHARLANAFVVRDVPYHWERGHSEPLP